MKIDLKLLSTQKDTLLNVINTLQGNTETADDLTGILHMIDAIQDECQADLLKLESTGKFPNGFEEWAETHHEMVVEIERYLNEPTSKVALIHEMEGTGGLYLLAIELTDKFEALYAGRDWDGEYHDALDLFLETELHND